jgi:predicted DNA-binding protein (MmcQ/YjbR family)
MDIEQLRDYCLSKKGVIEDYPFGDDTVVFKVGSKMFCFCGLEQAPFMFTLKCDPERAIELRETYEGIIPGYHTNKKHWNSLIPEFDLPDNLIAELIDHSYDLVFCGLKKSEKAEIENL